MHKTPYYLSRQVETLIGHPNKADGVPEVCPPGSLDVSSGTKSYLKRAAIVYDDSLIGNKKSLVLSDGELGWGLPEVAPSRALNIRRKPF